eukprot:TRINITY_DN6321_c0_g1_i1.p1 TRINITY_DN6321_c0_g1~~TRINITY_DN6321_c0_g1_i1.p1  ORF type:complete len:403 (-),score=86.35 TRINITY_DN6321_c0_g1_i1:20-1228(-)
MALGARQGGKTEGMEQQHAEDKAIACQSVIDEAREYCAAKKNRRALRAQSDPGQWTVVRQETETASVLDPLNIILVGRSRAGKSTASKVVVDPYQPAAPMSFYSQTREPFLHKLEATYQPTTQEGEAAPPVPSTYRLQIMDTPGLCERSSTLSGAESARDNAIIQSLIGTFTQTSVKKIHLVCYVCSFESGVSNDDVQAIGQLVQDLRGPPMCLLVTRCEKKAPRKCAELEKQIRSVPELRKMFGLENEPPLDGPDPFPKILFIGSINMEDVERNDVHTVSAMIEIIQNSRAAFLQFVTTPSPDYPDGFSVAKLPAIKRIERKRKRREAMKKAQPQQQLQQQQQHQQLQQLQQHQQQQHQQPHVRHLPSHHPPRTQSSPTLLQRFLSIWSSICDPHIDHPKK